VLAAFFAENCDFFLFSERGVFGSGGSSPLARDSAGWNTPGANFIKLFAFF
jgi:hypothetical protein